MSTVEGRTSLMIHLDQTRSPAENLGWDGNVMAMDGVEEINNTEILIYVRLGLAPRSTTMNQLSRYEEDKEMARDCGGLCD